MNLGNAKYVVTGGAGFIGSSLVRELLARGASVVIVDNLVNGTRGNVEGLLSDRCHLVVADIRDVEAMRESLGAADAVLHLACLGVRHSIYAPQENHDVNATATLRLLGLARQLGVPRFVYVSSSEVYGTALSVPQSEEHPTVPMTVYGSSKLAGECYTRAYHRTYDYPTVVVRPFNSYGPRSHHEGDSGEVIPKFMLRALAGEPMIVFGDGTQSRDFTYVSDTARGILEVGLAPEAVGLTVNLGSGTELSISELADEVRRVTGRPEASIQHVEARPGDVLRLCADISIAKELTAWAPEVSLTTGLTYLREWYANLDRSPTELLREEITRNWQARR